MPSIFAKAGRGLLVGGCTAVAGVVVSAANVATGAAVLGYSVNGAAQVGAVGGAVVSTGLGLIAGFRPESVDAALTPKVSLVFSAASVVSNLVFSTLSAVIGNQALSSTPESPSFSLMPLDQSVAAGAVGGAVLGVSAAVFLGCCSLYCLHGLEERLAKERDSADEARAKIPYVAIGVASLPVTTVATSLPGLGSR